MPEAKLNPNYRLGSVHTREAQIPELSVNPGHMQKRIEGTRSVRKEKLSHNGESCVGTELLVNHS